MTELERRIEAARERMIAIREEFRLMRDKGLTAEQVATFYDRLQVATDEYLSLVANLLDRKYKGQPRRQPGSKPSAGPAD